MVGVCMIVEFGRCHGERENSSSPTAADTALITHSCAIKGVVERARPNAQ